MSVEALKAAGNEAFAEGRYSQAVTSFTEAIKAMETETKGSSTETHPQAAALYSNRAASYLKLDKHLEALHDADKCILAKPDWWKGHCRKAFALEGLERYEECEESLKEALKYETNDEIITKLRHVSAVVEKRKRDAGKPQNSNNQKPLKKSTTNRAGGPMDPPQLVYHNWRDTANSNSSEPTPTEGSRKGQKLQRRPSILDVMPTKPGHPMFFPAEPKWPQNVDSFANEFLAGMTDPSGAAPPQQETKFLMNLAANAYLNQKQADDAYRKSKKIIPACEFCGIELKMKEPPCCECGEPYCSRQCMELAYKDHKKICDTIREQSSSLSMFHQLYWDGCRYGAISWIGERVKNYSKLYYEKRAQLKNKKGGAKEDSQPNNTTSSSSNEVVSKKSKTNKAASNLDENDVEDIDELTYLMMHERPAVANLCTQVQTAIKEAMAAGNKHEQDVATEELCAVMLEQYLRMTYYDAKHDTPQRCQFKLMMAEMLMGVITQFNLAPFVEPLDVAMKRFEPALQRGGLANVQSLLNKRQSK